MTADSRAPWRYVVVTTAIAAGSAAWYLGRAVLGGPVAWGYLAVPAGAAVAAYAIVDLLRSTAPAPVARRFWSALLVGVAAMAVGYAVLAVQAFRGPGLPVLPWPAALLIGAGFLAAGWAVARVPVDTSGPRWRSWLDRTIVFLGCATMVFHFGVGPMLLAADPWSTQTLAIIILSSVFAVGTITKVSGAAGGPVDRGAVRLTGAMGLVGAVVAFVAAGAGPGGALPAQALVMPLAAVLVTLAVRRQQRGSAPSRSIAWLPYLAVAAVDVPLLSSLAGPVDWVDRVVVCVAVLVTALVAARQFVTIRENTRLLADKRASEERLRHEVTHDGLTGLANRRLFRERLAAELAGPGATVLLVDLDDFKTVNDSLGHEVGDHLLIAVADMLRETTGAEALPVRLGGDEFAVLLPGVDEETGEAVAQRILTAFAAPMSRHDLLVRASIGIAAGPAGSVLDHVLRDADTAMYAAKERGKATFVRYHDGMQQPVLAHARLGGELRRALDAGEFRLVYQPVVELATGRIIGAEALVRWHHPTRGVVAPGEFIPAAEGTGLIVELGRFVVREALLQAARWLAEFGPDALYTVGPNVSARQLHDPDFAAHVRDVLAETGLPASRVVMELTESSALRGTQITRTLQELSEMGINLALDDFGTGESSLSLLRTLPVSIIKLDKSFVDSIERDEPGTPEAEARQAVARAVVQLARALSLDTVAEGIECPEQAERLHALGYTLGQGFHLARPMSADDMTRLLAARRDLVAAGEGLRVSR